MRMDRLRYRLARLRGVLTGGLTLCAVICGCKSDFAVPGLEQETADGMPVVLTAAIASLPDGRYSLTRAATDVQSVQFLRGETFHAYFPTGVNVGSAYTACGADFTTTDNDGHTTIAAGSSQPYFNPGVSTVTVHAYYPATVNNTTSKFSVQLDQKSNSDAGTANYKNSDLMYATTNVTVNKAGGATSATGELTFTHKMSKIIVNATSEQGISYIQFVRIVGGKRTITITDPLTCTLSGEDSGLSDALSTTSGNYIQMLSSGSAATVSCAALLPPQTINGSFLQVGVVTTGGQTATATYSLASTPLAGGYSYTFDISVQLAALNTTTAINAWQVLKTTTLDNYGTQAMTSSEAPDYVEAVDLGIRVVIAGKTYKELWANMNVGAEKESDFGNYYAFGETSTKTTYTPGNYIWGASSPHTKYNPTDRKTELDPEDDAAHVLWGGTWRLPSKEQVDRFNSNVRIASDTRNGVQGVSCISTVEGYTNQSIFIPYAGRYYPDYVTSPNYYLTRSIDLVSNSNYGCYYFFNPSSRSSGTATRLYGVGYPARAVKLEPVEE